MIRTRVGVIRIGTEKLRAVSASSMPQWASGAAYFSR